MNRRQFTTLAGLSLLTSTPRTKTDPATKPWLALPDAAKIYDIGGGGEARILVTAEQSADQWWLGVLTSAPGRKTSLHVHFSAAEQFYVLEGVLSAWLDGRWQELPAGSVAVMPPRTPHALGNRSPRPVRFLASGNPAGFERFFADIESLARHFPYGSKEFLDELTAVYSKYDSQLLGPPPLG